MYMAVHIRRFSIVSEPELPAWYRNGRVSELLPSGEDAGACVSKGELANKPQFQQVDHGGAY